MNHTNKKALPVIGQGYLVQKSAFRAFFSNWGNLSLVENPEKFN
ncbi:hypothetical protein [Saccharococcus thermophilus]